MCGIAEAALAASLVGAGGSAVGAAQQASAANAASQAQAQQAKQQAALAEREAREIDETRAIESTKVGRKTRNAQQRAQDLFDKNEVTGSTAALNFIAEIGERGESDRLINDLNLRRRAFSARSQASELRSRAAFLGSQRRSPFFSAITSLGGSVPSILESDAFAEFKDKYFGDD